MRSLKILGIAVGTGQCGFALLHRDTLTDWGTSEDAIQSTSKFVGFLQERINELKPDVVVTEVCGLTCRKGLWSRKLIGAATELASHNEVHDVSIHRPRRYQNKYVEASALAKRYPEVAGYLPQQKRYFFNAEPRGMILFEAIILAETVMYGSPVELAKSLG